MTEERSKLGMDEGKGDDMLLSRPHDVGRLPIFFFRPQSIQLKKQRKTQSSPKKEDEMKAIQPRALPGLGERPEISWRR